MEEKNRIRCKKLLSDVLDKLLLMEYNYNEFQLHTLKKMEEILKKKELFVIDRTIKEIIKENDLEKKQNIIDNLLKFNYDNKPLSFYMDLFLEKGKLKVTKKGNIDIIEEIYRNLPWVDFYKKSQELNISNYTKNLFTLYESFYSELAKTTYSLYPEKFLDDKSISLNELNKLKFDYDAVLENLIELNTKNLTNQSTKLKDVCETLKIDYNIFSHISDSFDEIYYRRNILTHGNGQISNDYKKYVKPNLQKKFVKENKIIFTKDYSNFLYETITIIIFQLFINSIYREEVKDNDIEIIENCVFDTFFTRKQWVISKCIYNYLRKLSFSEDCGYSVIFNINYMCCLKELGEIDELKKQLKRFNVSNMSKRFKVVKKLLSDDYTNINEEIESVYSGTKIKKEYFDTQAILKWPIFRWYIKTENFKSFKEKHKKDFEQYFPSTDEENC